VTPSAAKGSKCRSEGEGVARAGGPEAQPERPSQLLIYLDKFCINNWRVIVGVWR